MPGPSLTLRPAGLHDAELLLAWRNDPVTRSASFSTAPVTLPEHQAWLARRLADPGTRIWVAEAGGEPVGHVRAERDGAAVELHIVVAPVARGRGHAAAMLELAVARAAAELGARRAIGRVKPSNPASRRAFERAGFVVSNASADPLLYERDDLAALA